MLLLKAWLDLILSSLCNSLGWLAHDEVIFGFWFWTILEFRDICPIEVDKLEDKLEDRLEGVSGWIKSSNC